MGCHALLRGIFQPRDRTCVFCIAGRFFTVEPPGKHFLCCLSKMWPISKILIEAICISSSVLKDTFTKYAILDWQIFCFQHFKDSLCYLLTSIVSDEKSLLLSFYCILFLDVFRILPLFQFLRFDYGISDLIFVIFLYCSGSLIFFNLWVYSFLHIGNFPTIMSLNIFPNLLLLVNSFAYVSCCDMVSAGH